MDMEKDDITSPSGVGPNTRKLVKAGVFGTQGVYSQSVRQREEIKSTCHRSLITVS